MSSREEVVASAMYAMAEWVKQAGDDPLGAWAPVLDKLPGIPGDHTRRRVCKQLVENRGRGKTIRGGRGSGQLDRTPNASSSWGNL